MTANHHQKPTPSDAQATSLPLAALEARLGYTFQCRAWLTQALIHSSFAHECPQVGPSNERLEFLGDAVLGLVISDALLTIYPQAPEGSLSRWRAALVNARQLAKMAALLQLGAHLRLGRGEEQQAGRHKPSVLADAFEALVGAIYLDGGYAAAQKVVLALFRESLQDMDRAAPGQDYKTALQEYVQKNFKVSPEYRLLAADGPAHARQFSVEVLVAGTALGVGQGRSKKEASQKAARQAWLRLQEQEAAGAASLDRD
jgi:ribonuclease-3